MHSRMPEEKGLGSKLLGLFVETDKGQETPADGSEAVEKSPADIVAELANAGTGKKSPPAAAKVPGATAVTAAAPAPLPPMPKPTGPVPEVTVDFDAVFKGAGMDAAELDRVRKAEELLKSLPEATPQDVKRQIVEASLKAFGFETAKIVQAAQNQQKALDTYVNVNGKQTATAITNAQKEIATLEDKIISLKVEIEKKTATLAGVTNAAEARKVQVARVLEFFNGAPAPAAVSPKPQG